jgi:hypothetical protein
MLCSSERDQRFGEPCHFCLQGRIEVWLSLHPASSGFLFGLLLDSEPGSDMFSETSDSFRNTLYYNQENRTVHNHHREFIKSKIILY